MPPPPAAASARRRKALGAFYTPRPMAEKLVEWAVRSPEDNVLDPSFGGLVFLESAKRRLMRLGASLDHIGGQLHGCDLDEDAHAAALAHEQLDLPVAAIIHSDFFSTTPGEELPLAHAVVGNPPYIRFQGFKGGAQAAHRLARAADVPLTRLASSWAPFLIHSAYWACRSSAGRTSASRPPGATNAGASRPRTAMHRTLRDRPGSGRIRPGLRRAFRWRDPPYQRLAAPPPRPGGEC